MSTKGKFNFAPNPASLTGHPDNTKLFIDRLNFDAVVALAFEHHLALAQNIPLEEVVSWVMSIAKNGLIEYVDKADETVKKMLSIKGDIFPTYNQKNFEKNILLNGKILNKTTLSKTRILYEFETN